MKNKNEIFKACRSERGATMIEYALVASLIAIACIASTQALEAQIEDVFVKVPQEMEAAGQLPETL